MEVSSSSSSSSSASASGFSFAAGASAAGEQPALSLGQGLQEHEAAAGLDSFMQAAAAAGARDGAAELEEGAGAAQGEQPSEGGAAGPSPQVLALAIASIASSVTEKEGDISAAVQREDFDAAGAALSLCAPALALRHTRQHSCSRALSAPPPLHHTHYTRAHLRRRHSAGH